MEVPHDIVPVHLGEFGVSDHAKDPIRRFLEQMGHPAHLIQQDHTILQVAQEGAQIAFRQRLHSSGLHVFEIVEVLADQYYQVLFQLCRFAADDEICAVL